MSIADLQQSLYTKIARINDPNRLSEILSVVDESLSTDALSPEEIAILDERRERYRKGEEKAIPVDEFNANLAQKYGF